MRDTRTVTYVFWCRSTPAGWLFDVSPQKYVTGLPAASFDIASATPDLPPPVARVRQELPNRWLRGTAAPAILRAVAVKATATRMRSAKSDAPADASVRKKLTVAV